MAAAGTKRKLDIAATTRFKEAEEVCFTWRLEGLTADSFTGAANGAVGRLLSPEFSALGKEWRLQAYLNGETAEDAGHLSVYLALRTPNTTITPYVPLSIGDVKDSLTANVFSTAQPKPEGSGKAWGSQFLSHKKLLAKPAVYFPGGIMKATATLKSTQLLVVEQGVARVAGVSVLPIPPPSALSDLASLLASGEGADVTLRCGAVHISAHSPILCARSPVLKAHLIGPLACSLDNVPVPPEIDEHTLRRTLTVIYTDELVPESAEEAQHLLNAADHYGLPRLRAICENTLAESLSVDNAAFTLTLAEQHGAAALKDAALRFVASNAVPVMATEGWRHLKAASPALVDAAMITAVTSAPPAPVLPTDPDTEGADGEARRAADGPSPSRLPPITSMSSGGGLLAGIAVVDASAERAAAVEAERKSRKRERKDKRKAERKKDHKKDGHKTKRHRHADHPSRRHASDGEDSGSSSEEDEGQETAAAAPEEARRDEAREATGLGWMANPEYGRVAAGRNEDPAVLAAAEADARAKAEKRAALELNPFWSAHGTGAPPEAAGPQAQVPPGGVTVGDGGMSWRMKALKRAQERAAAEGRPLDDVVKERWGSLAHVTASVTSSHGAHAKSHLRATAERRDAAGGARPGGGGGDEEGDMRRLEQTDRSYLRDVGRDGAQGRRMMHPTASGRDLSWRAPGGDRPSASSAGRPGDWTCPQCKVVCFAFRKTCHKCGTSAPDGEAREQQQSRHRGDAPPPRRGAVGDDAATVLGAAARELNQFANDGSFLQQFVQPGGDVGGGTHRSMSEDEDDEQDARASVQPAQFTPAARSPMDSADAAPRPQERAPAPHPPQSSAHAAGAQGNESAAAALRARLLGKPVPPPPPPPVSGDGEEEVVALPLVTADGRAAPGAFGRTGNMPSVNNAVDPTRRPAKLQRFDATQPKGQHSRYYADDDGASLRDLVAQEKHGERLAGSYDANLARNIAKSGRFKGDELNVDAEYDHDGGLDWHEQRRGRGLSAEAQAQRAKAAAVADFRRGAQMQATCALCVEGQGKATHLHVARGMHAYLCVPAVGSLVPGHCLIVPLAHGVSGRSCDESTHDEMRNFKKCVLKMFAARGQQTVFMETFLGAGTSGVAATAPHGVIHAVPVNPDAAAVAPMHFRKAIDEAESEWSTHAAKRCIALGGSIGKQLRNAIPADFPYFHVEFGLRDGFVHVIDEPASWSQHFGRDILIGLLGLPAEEWMAHRPERRTGPSEQRSRATAFARDYAPFDWTPMLQQA